MLPTPSASTYGSNRGGAKGRTGKERPSLETMAARGELWPTATASDGKSGATLNTYGNSRPLREVALWPTATASDANSSGSAAYSTASGRHAGTTLTDATVRTPGPHSAETSTGGASGSPPEERQQLSPEFVEALMGFPAGWTQIGGAG